VEDFLILIIEPEWDSETVTEEDWKREAVLHRDFAQAVRDAGGEIRESNALKGNDYAVRVRPGKNGEKTVITDGPFLETKEIVSGYYIVLAADMAQATRFAELCPTGGYNEVHPIFDVSGY
jgi:hypothetical protein